MLALHSNYVGINLFFVGPCAHHQLSETGDAVCLQKGQ